MSNQLMRMLKSHDFLQRNLEDHKQDLSAPELAQLKQRIDRVFLDILSHEDDDARVTLIQVRFLLDNVIRLVRDPSKAAVLKDLCSRQIARLEKTVSENSGLKRASKPVAPAKHN